MCLTEAVHLGLAIEGKNIFIYYSFIFMPIFLLVRVAGTTALRGLEIPHGQQQFQVMLLAPHPVPSPRGALVGLAPQTKLQAPPN